MLEIIVSRRARKDLGTLPGEDQLRVAERVEAYATTPEARQHDVVPIVGEPNTYRLRVGTWRVIFEIEDGKMTLLHVRHRREAYR